MWLKERKEGEIRVSILRSVPGHFSCCDSIAPGVATIFGSSSESSSLLTLDWLKVGDPLKSEIYSATSKSSLKWRHLERNGKERSSPVEACDPIWNCSVIPYQTNVDKHSPSSALHLSFFSGALRFNICLVTANWCGSKRPASLLPSVLPCSFLSPASPHFVHSTSTSSERLPNGTAPHHNQVRSPTVAPFDPRKFQKCERNSTVSDDAPVGTLLVANDACCV
jgi:hypothetical protein